MDDAPKHTVLRIPEKDKGGPSGERFAWYQCTVKGGREGKDIDAIKLAKVKIMYVHFKGRVRMAVSKVTLAGPLPFKAGLPSP